MFPAGELLADRRRSASGPRSSIDDRAVGSRAVGAAGRGPDLRRHGVLAAVAHRGRAPPRRTSSRRARGSLLVEPRRMRDRAHELLDEEASLAETLAGTWGAEGDDFPRLSLPFERLLAHTKAGATSLLAAPDSPDTPQLAAVGVRPGGRRRRGARRPHPGAARRRQPRRHRGRGQWVGLPPARRARGRGDRGADPDRAPSLEPGTLSLVVAPLERGRGRARRRPRAHRRGGPHRSPPGAPPPPGRRARPSTTTRTSSRATSSSTRCTASGATRAWSPGRSAGVERDYLLLAYRGGDKLYVPTDQVERDPSLHRAATRRRSARWAAPTGRRPAAGCAARCRRSRPSW